MSNDLDTESQYMAASDRGVLPLIVRLRSSANVLGIGLFFGTKLLAGLALITASANWLPVSAFADFTQLSLLLAYLTLIASGGVVNGVIRQIAASENGVDRSRVVHAAVLIWVCASVFALSVAVAASSALSEVLTGSRKFAGLIVALTACSSVAGLGQLLCGALTGMGRMLRSLVYQGAGLLVGVAACLVGLHHNDVGFAALGFAGGPVLTTVLASAALAKEICSRSSWRSVTGEANVQMRFAGAFLITATIPPIILFGLRYVYRDTFGVTETAYWLLANRVSDINTQIVGLYLSQIFLPSLTATPQPGRPRVVARALSLCVGVSLIALVTFAALGGPLLKLVFHDQLAQAKPYVLGYLLGDTVRSIVSIAMICTLACNRPFSYAFIEVIAYLSFGTVFLILVSVNVVNAPLVAYPFGFALAGVIAWTVFVPELRPYGRARAD